MKKAFGTLRVVTLLCGLSCAAAGALANDWNSNPNNWENSSNNWDNSPNNWDNSPNNWDNSPNNWDNSPNRYGNERILRDAEGNAAGYAVPKDDGGVNFFDLQGNRKGYLPAPQ